MPRGLVVVFAVTLAIASDAAWSRASTPVAGLPAGRDESFTEFARRAAEARESGQRAEAVRLYREAVALAPRWDEGWWYLGALLHETAQYREGREALRRFVELKPDSGAGWALLGLCDKGEGDRAEARKHLAKGLFEVGLPGGELKEVALWHLAALYVKNGEFERAHDPLTWLARGLPASPALEDMIGLALLRTPLLVEEIPPSRRDVVRRTGQAGYHHLAGRLDEARRAYEDLARAFPAEPWIHYSYGASLKSADPARALAEFERELEVLPGNVYAHLEVAYLSLARADYSAARRSAARAAELAPDLFAGHLALGRSLLGLGEAKAAVQPIERAAGLAPDVLEVQVTLAQAYAEAGRSEDAARARDRATKLRERPPARVRP